MRKWLMRDFIDSALTAYEDVRWSDARLEWHPEDAATAFIMFLDGYARGLADGDRE